MRRMIRISILVLVFCALLALGAFASDEPGTASPEQVGRGSERFDVTIAINDMILCSAEVSYRVDGNVYSFSLKDLLDAVGMKVSFDEEARILSVAPKASGLMSDVLDRSLSDRGKEVKAASDAAKPARRGILSDVPGDGLMADVLARDRRVLETAKADPPAESVQKAVDIAALTPLTARERPIGAFFRTRSIA